MKYRIVAVGKLKEAYFRDAMAEYVKRIGRFATVEIVEVDECLMKGTPNERQIEQILQSEGAQILPKLEGYVVALDINGTQQDSVGFAEHLRQCTQRYSTFTFVVGGSYGLSDLVKRRADLRCSFGRITLPHQLCRVVLAEQLYRACCIQHNVAYHK